jgi:hypothetical protein
VHGEVYPDIPWEFKEDSGFRGNKTELNLPVFIRPASKKKSSIFAFLRPIRESDG